MGLAWLGWASPVRAVTEYRISAIGSATYTNNLNNAANTTVERQPSDPTNGLLLQATPSVSLSMQQARGQLTLRYDHSFAYAALGATTAGGSDALTASTNYELTSVDTLTFSANGTNSSLTNLLFATGPTAVNGVQTAGTERLLRLMLNEGWRHAWGPNWATQQSTGWMGQFIVGENSEAAASAANNSILTNSLALATEQGLNTFTLTGLLNSQYANRDEEGDWSNVLSLSVGWLRPLTENTSVNATIGAAQTLESGSNPFLIGGAGFTHEISIGQFAVNASRTQAPDLQTGRIFINDGATATFNTSLLRRLELSSAVSASISRRRSTLDDSTIDSLSASASVGWTREFFSATLIYTVLRQISSDSTGIAPDLTRGALSLLIGASYP
jgi:hypothetical protein